MIFRFIIVATAVFNVTTASAQSMSFIRPMRETLNFSLEHQSDLNTNSKSPGAFGVSNIQMAYKIFKDDEWSVKLGLETENIFTGLDQITLKQDDIEVDGNLESYSFSVGVNRVTNDKGKGYGVIFNFGSESDMAFNSSEEQVLNITPYYNFSRTKAGQWTLLMAYSNNRVFLNNVPLPSFSYTYRPSRKFIGVFGLPFVGLNWINFPKYMYRFFLTPGSVLFYGAQSVVGPYQVFLDASYRVRSFIHVNRTDRENQLFLEEKRILLGITGPVSRKISIRFSGGYSFDRYMYEGNGPWSTGQKFSLGNDWIVLSKLSIRI